MAPPYMTLACQAQPEVCEVHDGTVSIRVNGAHRRVPAGISVADLALELGLEPAKVAVERNLEIVPRSTLGRGRRSRTATITRSSPSSGAAEHGRHLDRRRQDLHLAADRRHRQI